MSPLLIPLGVVGSSKLDPSPYWVAIYGADIDVSNPYGFEGFQGMSIDSSGNSYSAGFAYIDYDVSQNAVGVLAKQDIMGNLVLQKSISSTQTPQAHLYGISADSSQNMMIHGQAGGGEYPNFWNYYFVAKLDPNGSILWQKQLGDGTTANSYGGFHHNNNSIDSSNNFYTAIARQSETPQYGYYITKFSSSGAVSWVRKLSSPEYGFFDKVAVDDSGNVFTGYDVAVSGSFTDSRAMITKLNSSGTLQWARKMDLTGTDEYSQMLGIGPDNSGGVAISGYYSSSLVPLYGFVAKFDSNGNTSWSRKIDNALFRAAAVGPDGSVFAFGDNRAETTDTKYLVKYNSSGTLLWQRNLTGLTNAYTTEMYIDSVGDIYVSLGYFDSANGTKTGMIVVKLPGDGSLTGDHSQYISYSIASLVDASATTPFTSVSVTSSSASLSYNAASLVVSDENVTFDRIDIR